VAKHLQFQKEYWDKLLSGLKTATIRLGKVTEYKPGDVVYIHCGGYVLGKAKITKVEYKQVKDLTDEDAFLDGFESKKKLKEALKKHYPKLKSEDWVTIIHFEWIEKFEKPIFSEEFAWKGIEIDPVKVAKLALEHLSNELTEKQKFYLNLIIQEGSIRKAAMKLGGLHKRHVFRRIIRKVLDKLIEKGILKPKGEIAEKSDQA